MATNEKQHTIVAISAEEKYPVHEIHFYDNVVFQSKKPPTWNETPLATCEDIRSLKTMMEGMLTDIASLKQWLTTQSPPSQNPQQCRDIVEEHKNEQLKQGLISPDLILQRQKEENQKRLNQCFQLMYGSASPQ